MAMVSIIAKPTNRVRDRVEAASGCRAMASMQAATARKNEERMAKTVQELIALGRKRGYQYPEAWAYKRAEIREKYRRRA